MSSAGDQYCAFQCSSASRKFLNSRASTKRTTGTVVSVLFSEPKIPQLLYACASRVCTKVSVLFSEPKIPQSHDISSPPGGGVMFQCSSASRKFLNSLRRSALSSLVWFQCSSASRKFLNIARQAPAGRWPRFQCSSASRKFLNAGRPERRNRPTGEFQCSSASRKFLNVDYKPQRRKRRHRLFQCSSASRKFLNSISEKPPTRTAKPFQCSSASRKFLNLGVGQEP